MLKPAIQYTKSGKISIAYQVFGSGKYDMVYIPGWISNIELIWNCPQLVDFLEKLSTQVRLILFDKRGTGLSDRLSDLSPLEERMDDIRAVMDAVSSKRAILFGHSEGGSVSALFSATYPDRTVALITFGVFARRRYSPSYPWAPTDEERQEVYDMIEQHWGSGEMKLESLAPSMKDDLYFMDWLARYFRSGASPSAALALTKMNTQIDIIEILPTISVPTLLLYRTDDIDVKIEEGKFIAERIPGARFVEFPGEDHLFWAGDSEAVLQEIFSFIANDFHEQEVDKILATVLKIKLNQSAVNQELKTKVHEEFINAVKLRIHQFRGELLSIQDHIITATFSGPSKAVQCATEVLNISKIYGLSVSQGLHIGEVEMSKSARLHGFIPEITTKLVSVAKPQTILVTETVYNLLWGTGHHFNTGKEIKISAYDKIKTRILKDVPIINSDTHDHVGELYLTGLPSKNDSFLERVIDCIEENIMNESFDTKTLAGKLFLSQRQLLRKVRSITNKSPVALIRSVKLHKARTYIKEENKSVKEAAYLSGFNSMSYFSKRFKEEFGMMPSELL